MDLLMGLNERQKSAVEHIEGPCLVLAGAGSGKTKVFNLRQYLFHLGLRNLKNIDFVHA